jgi:ADP-ribosylation factor-like protein 6
MGFWKSIKSFFTGRRKVNIVLVGLDNSGKTTVLNKLKPSKTALTETTPTIGYNLEEFTRGNLKFSAYDMGGGSQFRDIWANYYNDCDALIFVVDGSDALRLQVAYNELGSIIEDRGFRDKRTPVLVLANKTDLPSCLSVIEIQRALRLDSISGHHWSIFAISALRGDGLDDAFSWLSTVLERGS